MKFEFDEKITVHKMLSKREEFVVQHKDLKTRNFAFGIKIFGGMVKITSSEGGFILLQKIKTKGGWWTQARIEVDRCPAGCHYLIGDRLVSTDIIRNLKRKIFMDDKEDLSCPINYKKYGLDLNSPRSLAKGCYLWWKNLSESL